MANMDLQYILLDPNARVSYDKGVYQTCLLMLVLKLSQKTPTYETKFEELVIKDVYVELQMPLRRCIRQVIYVDTNQANDRRSMIKPFSQLQIFLRDTKGDPKFASWYDVIPKQKGKKTVNVEADELPETENVNDQEDNSVPIMMKFEAKW
ncbi:hypothetical protein DPMN_108529 [Dreissena polymorpha]|uniref:Uncharacterized protein n=1 Tax=Dreissena polymorpha TaxID=45954 RepID=A0A9D4K999_DREPO|nr:hypothetical protein DPMN_108529 [Dreissena polymorpha]